MNYYDDLGVATDRQAALRDERENDKRARIARGQESGQGRTVLSIADGVILRLSASALRREERRAEARGRRAGDGGTFAPNR